MGLFICQILYMKTEFICRKKLLGFDVRIALYVSKGMFMMAYVYPEREAMKFTNYEVVSRLVCGTTGRAQWKPLGKSSSKDSTF